MIDIKLLRDDPKGIEKVAKDKGVDIDVNKIIKLDDARKQQLQKIESLSQDRNKTAEKMKSAKDDDEKKKIAEEGKKIKTEISKLEPELKKVENELQDLMLNTPNIVSDDTPVGKDESDNVEVSTWGEPAKFDFEPKDHLELSKALNLLDTERGTKVAGFRGYFLKNDLMMMHLALMTMALTKLQDKGFELMACPSIVREMPLIGSGHFPGERSEIYEVQDFTDGKKETKYLSGTSEPALLAYHADEVLDEKDLPIKLAGFSSCYRREIGSHGKDTKGIYRVHEFHKVEQVVFCKNNVKEGLDWLEIIRKNSEELLQELGLPYRVVSMCTGDMGTGKYKMYDIETWMPSRNAYGETHSASYLTDWQARRIGIRYKDSDGNIQFAHTLNNTLIASPRILIAILENFQQEDGSVIIPEVLHSYMGGKERLILAK